MSKPNFDEFLKEGLENPSAVKPHRDLWPGIERALNQPVVKAETSSTWSKVSAVAACALVGAMSWQVTLNSVKEDTLADINELFEQQKQTLLVQYAEQPALTSDWKRQLQELEQAEKAIKMALDNDPESAALLKMLAQVYQQQLDLINRVHSPRWQQI